MRTLHLSVCSSFRWISRFSVNTTRQTTTKFQVGSELKFWLNLILFGTVILSSVASRIYNIFFSVSQRHLSLVQFE
jgi:hypothetical protein